MAGVADNFSGLPIEELICGPLVAVAKGQSALTRVYLDTVYQLAYKEGKPGGETNLLNFNVERPVVSNDGQAKKQSFSVEAPLISLVPIPAFVMDEATVQFTMEVKQAEAATDEKSASADLKLGYEGWGFTGSFSGSVASKSTNTRSTDQSAKYDIYARAVQQPPAEGMARLCQVFASMIEPINAGGGGGGGGGGGN
jgi:hypothetical protein